jgi:hypothetical protein
MAVTTIRQLIESIRLLCPEVGCVIVEKAAAGTMDWLCVTCGRHPSLSY